jgi:carbonic anhydrase
MKSNTLIKVLSVNLLITICLFSLNMCIKTDKSESVLEFFNEFFSTKVGLGNTSKKYKSNNQFDSAEEAVKLESEFLRSKKNRDSPSGTVPSGTAPSVVPSSNTEQDKLKSNFQFEDWLRISSVLFKNRNKFPQQILPDGKEVNLEVDANYFRINESFIIGNKDPNKPGHPLNFWFRLTSDKLYYTQDKLDYNILGSISYTDVKKNSNDQQNCLTVFEHSDEWLICAADSNKKMHIYCAIKKNFGEDYLPSECLSLGKTSDVDMSQLNSINKPNTLSIEDKVMQPIILIPLPSKSCNQNWDYVNNGNDWECTCKEGLEQSPVNLPETSQAIHSPVSPYFHYEEVSHVNKVTTIDGMLEHGKNMNIEYFKGALRIFHPNFGKIVTLDGAVYVAEEIVFHTPSEHTIDGKRLDMEMQIIHYGQTKGDISKQVVLSFLFQKTPGVYNKFIDDVDFFSLPNPSATIREITNNLFIPKIFYSSTSEDIPVMKPFSFYTYQGSLTFPPCTERTIHYVASEPIPIGSAPIKLFKEAIQQPDMQDQNTGKVISGGDEVNNYRETQPLNDRPVFFFDHKKYCDLPLDVPKKPRVALPKGHYEKINKKVTEYLWVTGSDPSGIPGTFVVGEAEAKGSEEFQA